MQNAWETHDWFDRPLEIDPSQTQFVCRNCGRAFIGDTTGKRHAIHASAFEVNRLSDEVTERWLAEPCSKNIQPTDRDDGKTRVQDRN